MERRSFIKTGCSLCMAIGSGLAMSTFSSCAPSVYKTNISGNKIAVPLALFEQNKLQIIRAENYEYDIAVRKDDNENFVALLMRCTHADNQLTNNGNGFTCSLHGSIFDKDGSVKKGPAERALKNFVTEKISDQLIIHLS
jgi:Rieske Fe-S protein